jgi:hypothetical protein
MAEHSHLTQALIRDGLTPPAPAHCFADLSPELQAAVNAYDHARRTSYGRKGEAPMSDANKASIAPFIAAACAAWLNASNRRVA